MAPVFLLKALVLPWHGALVEAKSELASEQTLLARELSLIREAEYLPSHVEQLSERLVALAPHLFSSSSGGGPVAYVERLASGGNVLLRSAIILPPGDSPVAVPEILETVCLQVDGESDLEGFLTLVRLLETGPKLIQIDSLVVERQEPASDATDEPETVLFSLVLYTYQLASVAGALEGPAP